MPGSTGSIRAGRAFVELFADDSKLVRGLRRAQKKLKAFGQSIRNMGLKIAGLGAAMVLLCELSDLPADEVSRRQGFSHRLRAIGHLFEAEDESQQWSDLHTAIREARKAYQASGTMPNWNRLGEVTHGTRQVVYGNSGVPDRP